MGLINCEGKKKQVKKKRQKPEWYIQKDIVSFFKKEYPEYLIYSCPNEATYRRREYFHQIGMMSGVSDLQIITDKRVLFIECKAPQGKQSTEQRQFQSIVENLGYHYYIVRSLDQFKEIIKQELNIQ